MKKFLASITLSLFVINLALPLSAFAKSFSDISSSPYIDAISFLAKFNVISGDEGKTTFRPQSTINRAEFAKIAVLTLDMKPTEDFNSGCFADVKDDSWYRPWVCQAKKLGLVKGQGDGTFYKPADPISRAEAITIVCRALNWESSSATTQFNDVPNAQWYSNCSNFAKKENFLPFTSTSLLPSEPITREQFAELVYRAAKKEVQAGRLQHFAEEPNENDNDPENNEQLTDTETDPVETPTIDQSVNANSNNSFSATTFEKIKLNQPFPNKFYKNEVYNFEGEITSGNHQQVFLFYFPKGQQNKLKTVPVKATNNKFTIPVHFNFGEGNYSIGIIPGTSGSSVVADVNISELPSENSSLQVPETAEFNINFKNDDTVFEINTDEEPTIQQVTFKKGGDRVSYLTRQINKDLAVNYSDFENFDEGTVKAEVQSATIDDFFSPISRSNWSAVEVTSFQAVKHYYTSITNGVSDVEISRIYTNRITFSGKAERNLNHTVSIIKPDGSIDDLEIASSTITTGNQFNGAYITDEDGTYIVEVNDTSGLAVINHPVYQSGTIPLIPDFFDVSNDELEANQDFDLQDSRDFLLNLINEEREKYNLTMLSLDNSLNKLAQDHSRDMIDREFFDHNNPDGKTPNQRAVEAGILTGVGENIAKSVSIRQAHELLIRSAIHLENIINPYWSHVGLGIAQDDEGYFLISQEFTTLNNVVIGQIIDALNDVRSTNLTESNDLQQSAQNWSDKMANEDFFATSKNGDTVADDLVPERSYDDVKILILKTNQVSGAISNILDSTDLENDEWQYIGLGLSNSSDGLFLITVLYGR